MKFQFPEISACKVTVFSCRLFNTGGGATNRNFLWGWIGSGVQTLKLLQTKICNLLVPFSDLFFRIHTRFFFFLLSAQNGSKTLPFGTAHTCMIYIGKHIFPRGRKGWAIAKHFPPGLEQT